MKSSAARYQLVSARATLLILCAGLPLVLGISSALIMSQSLVMCCIYFLAAPMVILLLLFLLVLFRIKTIPYTGLKDIVAQTYADPGRVI